MLQLMFFSQENLEEMKRNYLYLSGILCFPQDVFMSRFQNTHTQRVFPQFLQLLILRLNKLIW